MLVFNNTGNGAIFTVSSLSENNMKLKKHYSNYLTKEDEDSTQDYEARVKLQPKIGFFKIMKESKIIIFGYTAKSARLPWKMYIIDEYSSNEDFKNGNYNLIYCDNSDGYPFNKIMGPEFQEEISKLPIYDTVTEDQMLKLVKDIYDKFIDRFCKVYYLIENAILNDYASSLCDPFIQFITTITPDYNLEKNSQKRSRIIFCFLFRGIFSIIDQIREDSDREIIMNNICILYKIVMNTIKRQYTESSDVPEKIRQIYELMLSPELTMFLECPNSTFNKEFNEQRPKGSLLLFPTKLVHKTIRI